jgi:peptide/nickel transport system substrate-binding protein
MGTMRRILVSMVGLLVVLGLVGTGLAQDTEVVTGGTLTITTAKDAIILDPGRTNDIPSMNINDQIFDTLVALDADLNIVPWVAESWEANDDGTRWVFTIRDDVRFHDGTALTSADVAFSFQRILDAPEAASQKRSRIAMIESIETPDASTVVFNLAFPYAPFLGAARMHIVPKQVVEAVGEEAFGNDPVGSGPFQFESWRRDDAVVLVANEDYWLKTPNLARVVFQPVPDSTVAALGAITGDTDIVENLSGQMIERVRAANVDVQTVSGLNYFWIGFTQYDSPYDNAKFRQMVAHAIDLDSAIPVIFTNAAATRALGPVAPGLWPRDAEALAEDSLSHDPERARQLFDELVAEGVMTRETPVVFHVNNDPPRQRVAEYVVNSLQALGVNAELVVDEWSVYLGNLINDGEGQMYILGTTPAIIDPDAVFNWLFSSESNQGGVILGLERSEIDDLLGEARRITDEERRVELYTAVQDTVLYEQTYHIPGYHTNVVAAVNPRVHDFAVSPLGTWRLVTADTNVWVDDR